MTVSAASGHATTRATAPDTGPGRTYAHEVGSSSAAVKTRSAVMDAFRVGPGQEEDDEGHPERSQAQDGPPEQSLPDPLHACAHLTSLIQQHPT